MRSSYIHPDLLFKTRSGVTPHVLWGVPFTESFFGETLHGWETLVRKQIYALFNLTASNTVKEAILMPEIPSESILTRDSLQKTLAWASKPENLKAGVFAILAIARSLGTLLENEILTSQDFAAWWENLEGVARDAGALQPEKEPVAYVILAGELPLTLVYVAQNQLSGSKKPFLTKTRAKQLLKQSEKVLTETLDSFLDGAGTPRSDFLPYSRMLTASWVRARWLDQSLNETDAESVFNSDSLSNLEWCVRMQMYFTRPDGSMPFTRREEKTAFWCPELFVAALKVDSDCSDKKLGVSILPDLKAKNASEHTNELPAASMISPWGRSAIMQTNWQSRTGVTLTWEESTPRLEISNRKSVLFSGLWGFNGTWNGRTLQPVGDWHQIFWNSTESVDCIELELPLSEGFTLQRHVILAKEAHFAILGDALSADYFHGEEVQDGILDWETRIPIFSGCKVFGDGNSLELQMASKNGPSGTLIPLAHPEWYTKLTSGNRFGIRENTISASYRVEKSAFYAPIFIDLDPRRTGSSLTWRRLSVGEKLQNVPPHRATGFRIQIGDSQWLLFRALAECCNRSVLGLNLNSETYVGTFQENGTLSAILEIEKM